MRNVQLRFRQWFHPGRLLRDQRQFLHVGRNLSRWKNMKNQLSVKFSRKVMIVIDKSKIPWSPQPWKKFNPIRWKQMKRKKCHKKFNIIFPTAEVKKFYRVKIPLCVSNTRGVFMNSDLLLLLGLFTRLKQNSWEKFNDLCDRINKHRVSIWDG